MPVKLTDQEKIKRATQILNSYSVELAKPVPGARSFHQQRVDAFMVLAEQEVPAQPMIPDEKTRILRAKLILEEAFETVKALGVDVTIGTHDGPSSIIKDQDYGYRACGEPNLEQIADGCADLKVVTTGTLSACGIADEALQHEVDCNNLQKFSPGGHRREDGKWVKPPNHPLPDTKRILESQKR